MNSLSPESWGYRSQHQGQCSNQPALNRMIVDAEVDVILLPQVLVAIRGLGCVILFVYKLSIHC